MGRPRKPIRPLTEEEQRVVESNMPLVLFMARKYFRIHRELDFADLVSEGTFGLIYAVQTHDPSRGKLSTHAPYKVWQRMWRALQKERKDRRRCPSIPHDAAVANWKTQIHQPNPIHELSMREHVERLNESERLLVLLRTGIPKMGYQEIGREMGMSHESVRVRWKQLSERFNERFTYAKD